MEKLACVVVLYNPNNEIVNKVIQYKRIFRDVILIDNSDSEISMLCDDNEIIYIPLKRNHGIAHALNIGIERAIEIGYEWVMTLDQDSIINKDCIKQLNHTINNISDNNIAIISANYEPDKYIPQDGIEETHFVITSGTVLRTEVFKKLGPYINDMFIDAVDYEYCYRAVSKGYKILRDNKAIFSHTVGNPVYVKGIKCRNYPAFRYYFITRNNLIVSKMYKNILPESMGLRKGQKKYQRSVRYEDNTIVKKIYIFIGKMDYLLWLITGKYYCHIKI